MPIDSEKELFSIDTLDEAQPVSYDNLFDIEDLDKAQPIDSNIPSDKSIYNAPEADFGDNPTPFFEKIGKGFGTGVAGMVEGVGGVAKWFGIDGIGDGINKYAEEMKDFYEVPDPDFLTSVSAGFGSMATFVIPGLGISKGAQAISFAPRLATWLGISASSVMEASVEAGGAYNRMIAKGGDHNDASLSATKDFWLNLPVLVFTNKFGIFGENGGAILKGIKSASGESVQEFTQQIIGNFSTKDPLMQGALESAAVGAIVGGGTGTFVSFIDRKNNETVKVKEIQDDDPVVYKENVPVSDIAIEDIKGQPVTRDMLTPEQQKAFDAGEPIIIEPKEATDAETQTEAKAETEGVLIPDFKNTEEALAFGKENANNPDVLKALADKRAELKEQASKTENESEQFTLLQKSQFPREALEEAEKESKKIEAERPLIEEAKKYKTAEEFVKKGNIVFHGQGPTHPTKGKKVTGGLTRNIKGAQAYAGFRGEGSVRNEQGGVVSVIRVSDLTEEQQNILEKGGNISALNFKQEVEPIAILDAETAEQQLTEIWNKAQEEKSSKLPPPPAPPTPPTTTETQPPSEDPYEKAVILSKQNTLIEKAKRDVSALITDTGEFIAKQISPLTTQALIVSPKIKDAFKKFEFNIIQSNIKSEKSVHPFYKKVTKKKLGDDYARLDLALMNRDVAKIKEILEKYGAYNDYLNIRKMLDTYPELGAEVGIEINTLSDYWPRMVRPDRLEEFLAKNRGKSEFNFIEEALEKRSKEIGMPLSEVEKSDIIAQMISGYGINQVRAGGTQFSKTRVVDQVAPEDMQYYVSSYEALLAYIQRMNNMIEVRRFLGRESKPVVKIKSDIKRSKTKLKEIKETDPKDVKRRKLGQLFAIFDSIEKQIEGNSDLKSVEELKEKSEDLLKYISRVKVMKPASVKGMVIKQINKKIDDFESRLDEYDLNYEKGIIKYVKNLVDDGIIKQNQIEKVTELIRARINKVDPKNRASILFRDLGYFTVLNDFINGITQLGDLPLGAYKNGYIQTVKSSFAVLFKAQQITRQEIVGDIIADEFKAFRNRDNIRKFFMDYFTLIGPLDRLGKGVFVDASWKNFQKLAKKNDPTLIQELDRVFEEAAGQVLQDLKDGVLTNDTRYLVFSELSEMQPITPSENPQGYLQAGDWRPLWQLKTFPIKISNIAYQDGILEIQKGNVVKGLRNLARLFIALAIGGASLDFIKDLILGRKPEPTDSMIDGILQLVFMNRYTLNRSDRNGFFKSWVEGQIPPTFKLFDDLIQDSQSENEIKDWESLRNLPEGELFYWWFGGGLRKKKENLRKERSSNSSIDRKRRKLLRKNQN